MEDREIYMGSGPRMSISLELENYMRLRLTHSFDL